MLLVEAAVKSKTHKPNKQNVHRVYEQHQHHHEQAGSSPPRCRLGFGGLGEPPSLRAQVLGERRKSLDESESEKHRVREPGLLSRALQNGSAALAPSAQTHFGLGHGLFVRGEEIGRISRAIARRAAPRTIAMGPNESLGTQHVRG